MLIHTFKHLIAGIDGNPVGGMILAHTLGIVHHLIHRVLTIILTPTEEITLVVGVQVGE